ncbi:MAG: DUF2911 domain-containing protein [Ferruginibacter sp.]
MKKLVCLPFFFFSLLVSAQSKFPAVDVSPLDVSYYPANYPLLKVQGKAAEPLAARVIYSRPQKNGRAIFGELIEYGKLWRLGANEATEIEFFFPVTIGNSKVKKGRYTLYAIPDSAEWTLVLNRDTDTWGSFRYDQKKDLLRIKVPVEASPEDIESFTMYFDKAPRGFSLIMAWDKVKVTLPISY